MDLDSMTRAYNTSVRSLIDRHAPELQKVIPIRPYTQWHTDELRTAKISKRQAERKWRKFGLEVHRQIYRDQCSIRNKMLQTAKTNFSSTKIIDCGRDQKAIVGLSNHLLGNKNSEQLPDHETPLALADRFGDYFYDKIVKIRENLSTICSTASDGDSNLIPLFHQSCTTTAELCTLQPATEDEVRKVVKRSPTKSCELDPLPTWLLKQCLDEFIPVITCIINKSLVTGKFPDVFKEATIRPLLKKPGLDRNILKNFRPISNLPFLSKVTEHVVADRLDAHLDLNDLHDPLQSAYKQNHSTETALLKVQDDIMECLDNNSVVILLLLDLSAAFDTFGYC